MTLVNPQSNERLQLETVKQSSLNISVASITVSLNVPVAYSNSTNGISSYYNSKTPLCFNFLTNRSCIIES